MTKTKKEWDQEITNITATIQKDYPELIKYIDEMPIEDAGKDEISTKNLEEYYHSLKDLVNKFAQTHIGKTETDNTKTNEFPGYPPYPPSEDIYQHSKEESNINPEDISKTKSPNEKKSSMNEKSFEDNMSGDDLDVPGSELDDDQENVGSEDEENNYYSLGGDAHNDLEEDKG